MSDKIRRKGLAKEQEAISRRSFLKDTGLVLAGAALASTALGQACTTKPPTSTTKPPTSSTKPIITGFAYVPPVGIPPLLDIPGCTTKVAADRMYTVEHVWCQSLSDEVVVIGITDKLQALIGAISHVLLEPVGSVVTCGKEFGSVEGSKMEVDVISPVSGWIIQINTQLFADSSPIKNDPYIGGWMVVVQLSKPEELKDLLTGEYYGWLQSKAEPPPTL